MIRLVSFRAALVGAVSALAVAGGVMAPTAGCQQVQAAFPTLNAIEQVVAKDLAAGVTDAQMASDVCAVLGGSALTDAVCADATQLVVDAVNFLLDSGSVTGVARTNALSYKARHAAGAK
jgi:hypothetical protein